MLSPNTPNLSYSRLTSKGRRLKSDNTLPQRRIAILSDAASQQFVPLLRALFQENGVSVEIFEGAFDAMELEVFNTQSGLYEFKPDVILLVFSTQALRGRYFLSSKPDFVSQTFERLKRLWTTLRAHSTAQVIQFNYAMPNERFFGNYDVQVAESLYGAATKLNALMAEEAGRQPNVSISDVEAISSNVGRSVWFDDRLWNLTKAFCRLDYLPLVCQNVVETVRTLMGHVTKCLVLDLDNTLWGGIVGDDGHLGIQVGAHGDGEAFFHFQHYLLGLKQRGILLTVCSKNDLANALKPFTDNSEMVLKRDDITVFVANWDNKADNISSIRDRLNIGFDSMVFLDDNPFERNLVRQLLPDVVVPELPEDPAEYVRFLSDLNLFEATGFSREDAIRGEQYRQEASRLDLRDQSSDIGEYLRSLDMQIRVRRFDSVSLARIAQLTQRSNQFNLTTRRLNEGECNSMMLDVENFLPLYATLSDRFGDHGLISVVTVRNSAEELVITDWLMSCRVLARGIEEFLMNYIIRIAVEGHIRQVRGEYIPTAKNSMVQEFFAKFGFQQVASEDARTSWIIDPKLYISPDTYIREVGTE